MKLSNDELMDIALNSAKDARLVSRKYMLDPKVISNDKKDIKTLIDIEMNNVIISKLIQTDIPVLSEEGKKNKLNGLLWIVDPLDGTLNFSRNFNCYSISISLWKGDLPLIGLVYDISSEKIYQNSNFLRATLNNKTIGVSSVSQIEDAILATGFSSGTSYETNNLLSLVTKVQSFKKLRALGSASIMLAHVASGIFDVYYEKDIYLWDVAAGLSIVKASGGKYFIRKTNNNFKYEVLASNSFLFEDCYNLLIKE